MPALKAVLDTNLFISLLLGSSSLVPLAKLVRSGKVCLVVSPAQLAELTEVLHRPKFNFSPAEIEALLRWLRREAHLVTPEETGPPISRDVKDDFLVRAAVAGEAFAVVTRDKDLLTLGSYKEILFLSPSSFLSRLAESS